MNRIVTIDPDLLGHPSGESIAEMRKGFNAFGINPFFIVKGIEILAPDKKRKKHRLTMKRRCKIHCSLTERGIDISIDRLRRAMCL